MMVLEYGYLMYINMDFNSSQLLIKGYLEFNDFWQHLTIDTQIYISFRSKEILSTFSYFFVSDMDSLVQNQEMGSLVQKQEMGSLVQNQEMGSLVQKQKMCSLVQNQEMGSLVQNQEMGSLVQKQECISKLNLWFLPRIVFVGFTTTH